MPDRSLRILFVCDSARQIQKQVRALHEAGIEVAWMRASSGPDLQAALVDGEVDVVVANTALRQFEPLEAVRVARRLRPETPIICVERSGSPLDRAETERAGATGIVTDDDLARLPVVLRSEVDRARSLALGSQAERPAKRHSLAERWHRLVAAAPGALFELDLSGVFKKLAPLYARANGQLMEELQARTDAVDEMARKVELITFNERLLELVGVEDESELAKKLLAHADNLRPAWIRFLVAIAEGRRRFQEEIELPCRGRTRCFLVSGAAPRSEASLAHAVLSILEVTEERQLERRLLEGQRIEALGRVTGTVAHDFNNLMMVIDSCATLIENAIGPDTSTRRNLATIRASVGRGKKLTQELLGLSRQQIQKLKAIDLASLIRDEEPMLSRLLGPENKLTVRTPSEPQTVLADDSQIVRVLVNLCLNAKQAMPDGGNVTVEVKAVALPDSEAAAPYGLSPGNYVMLKCVDDGVGMSPEVSARAFEPFFTTRSSPGAGLGLATVYGIVTQSRGKVHLQSQPQRGTTVRVILPEHVPTPTVTDRPARARRRLRSPERTIVLLVEDDDHVRRLTERQLSARGLPVIAASSAEEAMTIYRTRGDKIALVLTDVLMGGISGTELAARLRADDPELPIIVMSGFAPEEEAKREIPGDPVLFLDKPCPAEKLVAAICDALSEPSDDDDSR